MRDKMFRKYSNQLLLLLSSVFFVNIGFAQTSPEISPVLNKVTVPLRAQAWVKVDSAKIELTVNSTLIKQDMEQARSGIERKLSQLAKVTWHIVRLQRHKDDSGLVRLQLVAEARVPMSDLGQLTKRLTAANSKGQQYKITRMSFQPSFEAQEKAYQQLRQQIYQQAANEIGVLDSVYKNQHYFLHQLTFSGSIAVHPKPAALVNFTRVKSAATAMPVSQKISLQAVAVLSAVPAGVKKHPVK